MKLPSFKRVGIFYLPQNLMGWLLLLAGIGYSVYRFIDIDSKSHSVSDTLRPFMVNLLEIFIVYTFLAFLFESGLNKKKLPD